jgi:hypothetical protein
MVDPDFIDGLRRRARRRRLPYAAEALRGERPGDARQYRQRRQCQAEGQLGHPHRGRQEWADAEQVLNIVALAGLRHYLRRYAHAVLAPLQLQMPDPATGELVMLDAERVATLDDGMLDQLIFRVFRPGSINLQKYIADQGGYPYWHCELYPKADNGETLHRVVLWTIYLNDGFREGETEFLYQNRRIAPKTGSLLIAPTAFTHTHRGNMPKGGDKYIATSWILFNRAEQLYANPVPPAAPSR